jgi:hypothetical protein
MPPSQLAPPPPPPQAIAAFYPPLPRLHSPTPPPIQHRHHHITPKQSPVDSEEAFKFELVQMDEDVAPREGKMEYLESADDPTDPDKTNVRPPLVDRGVSLGKGG